MPRTSKTGDKDRINKLIEAVQAHPCLYDKHHKDRKNKKKITQIWTSIARQVENSGKDAIDNDAVTKVKDKWQYLRDTYVRKKKKNETTWCHFSLMTFLDHYLLSQSSTELDAGNDNIPQNLDEGVKCVDVESRCNKDKCELVEAVKSLPCLYNPEDPDFGDEASTKTAWISVANKVYPEKNDPDLRYEVNWQWQLLRDKYVRKKKENDRKWKFYKQLSFLDHGLLSQSSNELNTGSVNLRQNVDDEENSDEVENSDEEENSADEEDKQVFIQTVQSHRSLFDPDEAKFGYRENAKETWKSIANQFVVYDMRRE